MQLGSRAEPLLDFRGKDPKIIWLFNVFKAIKRFTMGLKRTIFLALEAIPFHSQPIVPGAYTSKLRRILNPVAFKVGWQVLGTDAYLCNITIARRFTPKKHRKSL